MESSEYPLNLLKSKQQLPPAAVLIVSLSNLNLSVAIHECNTGGIISNSLILSKAVSYSCIYSDFLFIFSTLSIQMRSFQGLWEKMTRYWLFHKKICNLWPILTVEGSWWHWIFLSKVYMIVYYLSTWM